MSGLIREYAYESRNMIHQYRTYVLSGELSWVSFTKKKGNHANLIFFRDKPDVVDLHTRLQTSLLVI